MNTVNNINESEVIMKAFNNACKALGVSAKSKAELLGVDRSTITRKEKVGFAVNSKTSEIQLHFIRIYRSLYAIAGGDPDFMQHWFRTKNKGLNGVPLELCGRIDGIVRINMYLDAMRGKI